MLKVSPLGVGTVFRLERGAWSMDKWLRQAKNEYAPPTKMYILQWASVCTDAVKPYMYIGVGDGWQRRCKTC